MNTRRSAQTGAATLLWVLGTVVLASLASVWSSRAVLADLLASHALAQAAQARLAAQSTLAAAEAMLVQADALALMPQSTLACPNDLQGLQWQCSALALPANAAGPGWQAQALLARDLHDAPHVWQLRASAQGQNKGQADRALAAVRESVFMPTLAPAPTDTPGAALILNGCVSDAQSSGWQLCPTNAGPTACVGPATGPVAYSHAVPDSDGNGVLSAAERQACLDWPASSLPGAGERLGSPGQSTASPCNRASWRSVFGHTTPAQLKAWSSAQEQQGLHTGSQPARSIYWVDSPADWVLSLGSSEAPVLLVFSAQACAQRCPRIAAGVHIHGTVFADADCQDERMRGWQAGWVEGLVAIEAGLPQPAGNSRLWAHPGARQAFTLHWPAGIDSQRVQRVPGSRWEGLE